MELFFCKEILDIRINKEVFGLGENVYFGLDWVGVLNKLFVVGFVVLVS